MASNINPYNVDGTFPVAGQDNSSQGFRDNFTNIKNNFIYAQNEISDLQNKAIVTGALAGSTLSNDMAGTQIRRPQLVAWTQALLDLGNISTIAVLDFNQANFQKFTTANSIDLSFINWPSSTGAGALGYGVMRVWINVTSTSHTITLPNVVDISVNDIAGYNSTTHELTFDTIGNYIFDFSSIDGGKNYLIFDVTRNRTTFRDSYLYLNRQVNPGLFVGYGPDVLSTALSLSSEQFGYDTISSFGSYNSVSVGNLSLATQVNSLLDSGSLAGYTITSTRGNLASQTVSPVHSGDFLGYVNAQTYTGDRTGSGNVFQQVSSMSFFATGGNVQYGLGGNIAFFTMPEGIAGNLNQVQQALSINSDQSVEVLGALKTDGVMAMTSTEFASVALTAAPAVVIGNTTGALILDSINSQTIATANIQLPLAPVDKQQLRISSVAPITTANVYAANGVAIKYIPATYFASGNVVVQLTYNHTNATWYQS
jgi:hypothetical protein